MRHGVAIGGELIDLGKRQTLAMVQMLAEEIGMAEKILILQPPQKWLADTAKLVFDAVSAGTSHSSVVMLELPSLGEENDGKITREAFEVMEENHREYDLIFAITRAIPSVVLCEMIAAKDGMRVTGFRALDNSNAMVFYRGSNKCKLFKPGKMSINPS